MAESDKIKSEDIIQKDLFKNTIDSAEDLTTELKKLEDEFIKVAEAQSKVANNTAKNIKTAEDLSNITKSINASAEARERANKIQKERVKLEERLKIANSTAIDQNTELKVQLQEQNKINKEFAKEKLGLISAYDKESKRLIKLRKQYKDLAVQNKDNTKESRDLKNEINALDKRLKDIDASVGQFQRSVGDYGKEALGSTKATLALGAAIVGLNGGLGDLKTGFNANEEGSKELNKLTEQGSAIFSTFANRAGKAGTELLGFFKEVAKGDKSLFDFSETAVNVANSFNGVIDASLSAADAAALASDETFNLDREILALNESLAILNGEFERQSAIAGDSTRSFDELQEAAEEAEKINIRRLAIAEDIASRELKIIEDRIKATEDDSNRLALETEASEKRIALQEIQNELNVATIENEKVLKEIQRDRFERELDFAIDAFDAQKTINERQIADDRKTIEERQAIFNETERLTESSFQSQKDLFAEFVSDKVDFDELAAETDEAQIRRTLRQLDLDDIELGRALEVIRERKIALQDLDDAEREIADARTERLTTQLNAINEVEQLQIQAELDRLNALEVQSEESVEARFELEKRALEDQADFTIQTEKLTAEEIEVIRQQLANDIVNIEQQKADDLLAIQQQQIQNERDIQDARIDNLKQLNELSKTLAGDNVAAQKALLAVQKAIAVSEILINTEREVSDIRADDTKTDIQKTTQVNQARISSALSVATVLATNSAYDGVENTGTGGKGDDRGGMLWMLHPEERVMTRKQNMKVGDLSNDELANMAMLYNRGELVNPMTDLALSVTEKQNKQVDYTSKHLIQTNKKLDVLINKPVQQVNVDSFGNLVEVVYKNGVRDTKKYKSKDWI